MVIEVVSSLPWSTERGLDLLRVLLLDDIILCLLSRNDLVVIVHEMFFFSNLVLAGRLMQHRVFLKQK